MKSAGKNETLTNRKAVMLMMTAMVAVMMILLAVFWLSESQEIRIRAEKSIRQTMVNEAYEDRTLPPAYELYTEDLAEGILNEAETDLLNHYNENRSQYMSGSIYSFTGNGHYMYFTPINAARRGDEFISEDERLILYTDVSYSVHALHSSLVIMALGAALSVLLLFFISRRLLILLDKKDTGMRNFFANASHELKTPLMAIRGNVDGIRSGYVEPEKAYDVIEKETERMSALIGSILDLSKLDSGAVHMEVTMNDVREILYDAVGIILPEADKRGIQVNIEAAEPLFMECDERMIFSTFSNILTNALRYAEREISVRIEKQDKIIIRFINDGVPISDEEIAHIFDRFYKGDKGQTGLGVALAQEYVNLHGGEISAAARDNRTEFVIII
ncbi:MAG: HAMP domain-containing sensor histidine kinase [Anaerovoracaceae bacterium]|nr:HAMP domain-containing sensor histidine kinase [Anaerovoracaceae bacterium]